ncbi:glutathione S-transferase [Rhizobium cellulosilyticum]|uniref:Glutathione S-transferase n=1 Tax=Aliirhizobium cellulosilyticum TaxID=393664 RepID=A0A7W6S8S0_9HYPH|nr:glutathione S-transferase [Rhizobium cellulosilyticum]MBB4412482.1 glutathione S-transferase [Rhizobium cellulosilyticum]MBB4447114.1 glutathione S-transferase [Rhizobium cellulosilyticum]
MLFASDEISAAGIIMSLPLEATNVRGNLAEDRPAITEWLERIHARLAHLNALEEGGPYVFTE